uniref:BACK domain-containing protein n=1 Tax=Steinernema glaseri TaxID=37863 RepID=A0A1I7Y440_9BILA
MPATLPASFLVDYFFSESCRWVSLTFEDLNVVLEIIDRWKKMDPRSLTPNKIFHGVRASQSSLKDVGMMQIPMLLVDIELLQKIERKVVSRLLIKSLHRIDHPTDLSSKIYVIFRDENECSLLFE